MESVKSFFDSFKEFIWDIIGYLLPGSYALILLSVCVNCEYFVSPSLGTHTNDFYPFVFLVTSYLLGYVIYGFGWLKEKGLGKHSYVKRIESDIAKRPAFAYSKELLTQVLEAKKVTSKLNTSTLRDVRNLVMSFIPESDQKIYTFTFRSELSNQTGNISIIIGIMGLIFSCFKSIPLHIFKTDTAHIIIYICLLACYVFLRQTRNRFYAIAVGLPFSIYTANAIKK
jgi:hypothetical protein